MAVAVGVRNAEGLVDVAALGVKPVVGVNAGRIDNIEQVSRAVKEALDEVEEQLDIRVTEAYAGISGEFVRCARHTDHVFVYDPQNGVSQHDVEALFDRMRDVQAPEDETIMERVPQNYVVDDVQEVQDPVGSFGRKLSSTFNFVLCQRTPMQRLDMALRRLGIRMLTLWPDAPATAETVLSPEERQEGVALVDFGAGTTDVAVYWRDVLRYVATVPMGASAINADIRSLSLPEKYVEPLKCRFGSAVAELASESKYVRVSGRTAKDAKDILLRNLATVIEARVTDVAEYVAQEVKDSGYGQRLSCGLVLTGGSSRLKDVDELFRRVTGLEVRLGSAEAGLTEAARERLADPALATVAGLLVRGAQQSPCAVGERPVRERATSASRTAQQEENGPRRGGFAPSAGAMPTPRSEEPRRIRPAVQPAPEPAAAPEPKPETEPQPEPVSEPTRRPGLLERMKRTLQSSARSLSEKFDGDDEEI